MASKDNKKKESKGKNPMGRYLSNPLFFDQSIVALPPARFSPTASAYLSSLRTDYELDTVVPGKASDSDRVLAVTHWVSARWAHNGVNTPTQNDPISILKEAASGRQFRCVEYSIVLAGALASLGYPSRVLGLMTADVETRESCAGHVVTEAYFHDLKKWVMLDGQFDAMPIVQNIPVNAIELAQALYSDSKAVRLASLSSPDSSEYFGWVKPYFYYFTSSLDNRYGIKRDQQIIRLAPIGAREPRVFQRNHPLQAAQFFTHSALAFYPHAIEIQEREP